MSRLRHFEVFLIKTKVENELLSLTCLLEHFYYDLVAFVLNTFLFL